MSLIGTEELSIIVFNLFSDIQSLQFATIMHRNEQMSAVGLVSVCVLTLLVLCAAEDVNEVGVEEVTLSIPKVHGLARGDFASIYVLKSDETLDHILYGNTLFAKTSITTVQNQQYTGVAKSYCTLFDFE